MVVEAEAVVVEVHRKREHLLKAEVLVPNREALLLACHEEPWLGLGLG